MIPLKELLPEEPKVFTLDLLKNMDPNDAQNDKSRGQIVIELTYKPFKEEDLAKGFDETQLQNAPEGTPAGGGLLVVIVHEAQDIEGKYHTNPHVRLIFKGEERKTKVLDLKTCNYLYIFFLQEIMKITPTAGCGIVIFHDK